MTTRREAREARERAARDGVFSASSTQAGSDVPASASADGTDAPAARAATSGAVGVRGVLRLIGTGVMTGILAIIVLVGIAAIAVPAATGSTALTVMTSSMEPSLPPGTLIVVRPTPVEEIVAGDVITYQVNSGEPTVVTHRVTQQMQTADGEYLFTTKGDANPSEDPGPIKDVQIRGTVWYALPFVGWLAVFVTGDMRAVIVPIVVVALFGYALWMFIAALRDRRRTRETATSVGADSTVDAAPADAAPSAAD